MNMIKFSVEQLRRARLDLKREQEQFDRELDLYIKHQDSMLFCAILGYVVVAVVFVGWWWGL